jgi:LacI family transcriptional regulator
VTVRDVALAAGVSTATVSRALNGDSAVSPEAARAVLAAAKRLGYSVNHIARSLKQGSTRTIAVLAPELSNDFFMELAEAMERELEASGYMLLVSSSSNSAAEEERRLGFLSQRLVDGVVVIPASSRGEHLRRAAASGMPLVLVDRLVDGGGFDAVLADNEGGAFEATTALLADGHGRLAFVGGESAITTARERLAGFDRAVAAARLGEAAALRLPGGMGIEDGYRAMGKLLAEPDPPRALFAVNLLVHLGIERRLLEARDGACLTDAAGSAGGFSIASFDETPYSPFLPACRYVVAQPVAEMGRAAARLVLERVAAGRDPARPAPAAPRLVRLPTTLIRHSRGPGPR